MKHWASTLWLLPVLVLLCGCGGGQRTLGSTSDSSSGSPSRLPSGSSPQALNIAGNWQFITHTVTGTPTFTIAGSITQSSSEVRGAVHVEGSHCFDRLTTVGLTGTRTNGTISLTSASVDGQVISLVTKQSPYQLTGTYTIDGGCASGEQGKVTGFNIPSITYGSASTQLTGTFTTSVGEKYDVVANVSQSSSASSAGSFGITGTVTFGTSCLSSGTIASATFPSGSYILGTSVALKIETGNGTVTFLGTVANVVDLESGAGSPIRGTYTVSGGTCDQTGKAVLIIPGEWDY